MYIVDLKWLYQSYFKQLLELAGKGNTHPSTYACMCRTTHIVYVCLHNIHTGAGVFSITIHLSYLLYNILHYLWCHYLATDFDLQL